MKALEVDGVKMKWVSASGQFMSATDLLVDFVFSKANLKKIQGVNTTVNGLNQKHKQYGTFEKELPLKIFKLSYAFLSNINSLLKSYIVY